MIYTCQRCKDNNKTYTEIPYLWDCLDCRNLNGDYRCLVCGRAVTAPFHYCTIRCLNYSMSFGLYHPVVKRIIQTDCWYDNECFALRHLGATEVIQHRDLALARSISKTYDTRIRMRPEIKTNTYYTSGSTLFKILKVNQKSSKLTSVNAFYFVGSNRFYVEDLIVGLIRPFVEVKNEEVIKLLYE